jgi:hypothetical protein
MNKRSLIDCIGPALSASPIFTLRMFDCGIRPTRVQTKSN